MLNKPPTPIIPTPYDRQNKRKVHAKERSYRELAKVQKKWTCDYPQCSEMTFSSNHQLMCHQYANHPSIVAK